MVFQNYALYPHMTVYENLAFGLKLRKYAKKDIEARVQHAAKILGINEYLDRKPKALSGGQRQRVALGRAIVRQPKVFLFDEPLSNLDANLRVQMRTEISRLHHQLQTTMIYVTHDQIEAMSMGDRIVVLKDGVVQQVDTPLNIYHHPVNRFVAGFIGSPTMNFMAGVVHADGRPGFQQSGTPLAIDIPPSAQGRLQPVNDKPMTLGIRPEHIYIHKPAEIATTSSFQAQVEVVEPVGNEIFVYFSTGAGSQYVARIATDTPPQVGKPCTFQMDTSKLHFFDAQTEQALNPLIASRCTMARWISLSAALAAALIASGCGSQEQATQERMDNPPQAEPQPAMSIETRTDTVATIHPPAQEPPPGAAAAAVQRFKVQIGAFRDPQHASLVQNQARERFATAASNEYDTGSGTYRIRIGSFETRKEAEDFRKKMQQDFPGEYGDAWIIVPDGAKADGETR